QETGKVVIHRDDERTAAFVAEDTIERPAFQQLAYKPGHVLADRQLIGAGERERIRDVVLAQPPLAGLGVEGILNGAAAPLSALGAIVQDPCPNVERAELKTIGEPFVEIDLERIVTALADRYIAIFDLLILRVR